jgi:ABC-type antimicrobial peptide transport system permease subunit
MALGAGRATVVLAEARTAFTLVGWGVGLGLVAALAGASLIRSQLFGVSDVDPVALADATAVVSVVAALAMWIPAHRASRVDPIVALRQELRARAGPERQWPVILWLRQSGLGRCAARVLAVQWSW